MEMGSLCESNIYLKISASLMSGEYVLRIFRSFQSGTMALRGSIGSTVKICQSWSSKKNSVTQPTINLGRVGQVQYLDD